MKFEFLKATAEHMADLTRLNDFIQKQHADGDPSHFRYPLDKAEVEHFFSRILQNQTNHIFLALVDGAAVGYVWFEHGISYKGPFTYQKKQILVHHIFVQKEYRRSKVATGFFDIIEEEAKSKNTEEVILNTYSANEGAQAFFKSKDFDTTKLTMRRVCN